MVYRCCLVTAAQNIFLRPDQRNRPGLDASFYVLNALAAIVYYRRRSGNSA